MAAPINVIINAAWRGAQDVQRARRDLASIEDGSKKGARGLNEFAVKAGLAAAAIGTTVVVTRTLYETLERGAGLELTRQRFDRLAISIGTTGDVLRDDLAQATKGLLSDTQQMALATDILGLRLTSTADQTVRLARVSTELNQDMNELTLALTNQSVRRFDQLGVAVAGFDEKLQDLKDSGLSAEEAFTEAFLQQAEEQIERVGGVAGTAAGDLRELEAGFNNVKDASADALLNVVRFAGGFEDINEASEQLNTLADNIERLGENFDRALLAGRGIRFLSDPIGGAVDFFESVIDLQKELSGELEDYLRQNEGYQEILDGVVDTLEEIERLTGLELIGNMEAAVEEAESFDRALMNASNTLNGIINKIQDIGIAGRGGFDRGGSEGGRSAGTPPVETFGTIQERVNLFQDFQDDLTQINVNGQQERASIEEQYEQQRTQTVENYNRQRAEEEEDWQRRQLRQEQDLQRDIAEIQESAAEAEADAREQTNERLVRLERDHLRRMQEIIDNANLQLTEAASRLDAAAVARIQRQRDAALQQEQQNYNDQIQEIQNSLDEQLEAIQENMAERIEDLQEFHEERKKREEEDRAVRLRRMEEAHRRELQEIEKNRRQRLQELKDQIRQERAEREVQYIEERRQLTDHWLDRQELEAAWQQSILEQEARWWEQRLSLVGGGTAGGNGDGDGTAGGDTTGGGQQMTLPELQQLAYSLAVAQGYTNEELINLYSAIQHMTAPVLADFIERTFGYDVPGYLMGTPFVPQTGLAMLHRGERVLTAAENRVYPAGQGLTVNNNIYPSAGMDENALAAKVRTMTERVLLETLRV